MIFDDKLHEECGVFGAVVNTREASGLTYKALSPLQPRALRAAVLQGGQGIVGQARRFAVVDHGAEYAALFVQFVIKYHQKIPPF